ncbi:cysteate synthase [uncultured Methanomethylovorans sp.]|uniref:cysteate synthase n=1 Tax=uncultured Methanomethylovorans sp. TaxID=183759 RepID=UPI002AA92F44|nr:cysteate synthase [uncultured Methanomethylovorans sp.]
MHKYSVKCPTCGEVQDPMSLTCSKGHDSLLRTFYKTSQLIPRDLPGIWKFYDWLPVDDIIPEGSGKTITYKSEAFAKELGLSNLYVAFNGYWPEKNASMMTCTFKDLEAFPTMQRLLERQDKRVMVVASAGNTARSFAHVCCITGQTLLLVVPENSAHRLWTLHENTSPICLVTVEGDYYNAIEVANKVAAREGFVTEGGAKNVARRDGMGTVMLDAVFTMKELPMHYFQAVGSGTGGISAWEASMRLIQDGRFGKELPQLHLAQNLPCAPLISMWLGNTATKDTVNENCPKDMYDDVLFNRKPPFSANGGVRDALQATGGRMYGIDNAAAAYAQQLFEKLENIDINPASAIAVAALIEAVEKENIDKSDSIVLNITGGGMERLRMDCNLHSIVPDMHISAHDSEAELKIVEIISQKFKR